MSLNSSNKFLLHFWSFKFENSNELKKRRRLQEFYPSFWKNNKYYLKISGERWKKANRENEVAHVESERKSAQHLEKKICQAKLECFPCKRSFTSLSSFKRHVDSHMKLNRYQCNKCDYKSVTRNDCIGHCNRIHNGMNNRQVLNEMISTIPQDQLAISQEMDLSNLSSNDMLRSSSDAESRIRNVAPVISKSTLE